jgi:hypothetical protein
MIQQLLQGRALVPDLENQRRRILKRIWMELLARRSDLFPKTEVTPLDL